MTKKTPSKEEFQKYLLPNNEKKVYQACCYMEKGICFDNVDIRDCCVGLDGNKRGMPVLIPNYHGEIIDWDKIFEIKEKRNQEVREGNISEICQGCGCLSPSIKIRDNRCFSEVIYQNNYLCNARCIYCSSKVYRGREFYSALEATENIVKNYFFEYGGNVFFDGGEPTLMQDFDKIVELYLEKNAHIHVNSSGICYRESIYKGIEKGVLELVVSIDSGNNKLYTLIKQVEKFDEVVANISKYAKALNKNNKECLTLKYIIIPGVNDSVKDIDSFIRLVKKVKVHSVAFDIECSYANNNQYKLPNYLYHLSDYAKNAAEEKNLDVKFNIFFQWANEKRRCKKVSFKNFDKEKFVEEIESEKEKNISKNKYYAGVSKANLKNKK